jgi:O-antigen/teichoic acid export membrane protein
LSQERSLSVQAVALALGSGAAQVLVAVIYILTARAMQPEDFGVIATAMALGAVGAAVLDFGSNSYWIRELASGRMTRDQLNPKIATRILFACLAATLVVVVASATDPRLVATGVLRAELVGLLTAMNRAVSIIAFFLLRWLGVDAGHALWISIALGDLALVGYLGISERSQLKPFSRRLSNPWSGTKWYSLTALSVSAQQMDLPILTTFAGASAAGIYGGVARWIQPMILATGSFSAAIAPFLAAQADLRAARSQVLRASWMLIVTILISVGVIVIAPWLVHTLLGPEYIGATAALQWLAGAMILNAIAQPLIATLMARQFDHVAAVIMLAAVGAQLATVAALAPTLGAVSAGVGMFASQGLQIVLAAAFTAAFVWRRRLPRPSGET